MPKENLDGSSRRGVGVGLVRWVLA